MITIDKKEIKACCGKKQVIWKLNISIQKNILYVLQQAGFSIVRSYLDAGMLYAENNALIVQGVFGQNELRIKCKNKLCEDSAKQLEKTLIVNL